MKKIIIFQILLLFFSTGTTTAGWLSGPDCYEDCILESMKGVTSDKAALEIKRACRKKFPIKQKPKPPLIKLTNKELSKITGRCRLNDVTTFSCELHNGNDNLIIEELSISIWAHDGEYSSAKTYTHVFDYTAHYERKGFQPQTYEEFSYQIVPIFRKRVNWSIVSARGRNKY